ncbi:MAG: transcription termination factor Rho [Chloroflexota bacterium]|nr:transcription termination factor Rho [Chloroflexota bacterium]MDP6758486.1 transcription termination factor Rho [Chloroflexota bacterium]
MSSRRRQSRPRSNQQRQYDRHQPAVALQNPVDDALNGMFTPRELRSREIRDLHVMAKSMEIDNYERYSREEIIDRLIRTSDDRQANALEVGILENVDEGYGFLRRDDHWNPSRLDIYVSQTQIRKFGLRTGDAVTGQIRRPKESEKFRGLVRVVAVNDRDPDYASRRPHFQRMTPIFPEDQLVLENDPEEMTTRIVDLVAPIGRGQRGLIVSPPKAGKTELMKRAASAMLENYDDLHVIIALIGERPEEVTDWERALGAEVISSTFDESPESHCRVAELTIERARRLVEGGRDVMVFLDSITRLARAYNLTVPASGKTLTGGIDPGALVPPKRFFGSGRNIEDGGSLTVLASCLIDTGSRQDEVIYEEFKGTGNWELILNRRLAERGTFPAVDVLKSGTRRVELLLDEEETRVNWLLRRMLGAVGDDDAIELMMDQLRKTKKNQDFLANIIKQSL